MLFRKFGERWIAKCFHNTNEDMTALRPKKQCALQTQLMTTRHAQIRTATERRRFGTLPNFFTHKNESFFLGPSCQQTLLYETQHHAQTDCRDPETSTDLPTGANKHLPRPLKQLQITLSAFFRTFNTRNCSECQQQAGLGPSRTFTCGTSVLGSAGQ
jgi:hypothetical protein